MSEVVNDLRHQLSATLEHVPNLGQVGLTELVRLECQSHRRLRTACPDRSGLTKATERLHPAPPHTEIPVIHISNHIIEPIHEHTMWNMFLDILSHANDGFSRRQTNRFSFINPAMREEGMNLICMDTPSLWAYRSFNCQRAALRPASQPASSCL